MLIPPSLPVRLLTQNIRYDKEDPLFPGESKWAVRCPLQVAQYRFNLAQTCAGFICLQEALQNQITDILDGLNSNDGVAGAVASKNPWTFVGTGRDGFEGGGEYNPILYQPSVWELQQWWTRWLSDKPTKPGSKWPGLGLPRIVTMGHFKHRTSGSEVLIMCTHLDHTSAEARAGQARLLVQFASEFSSLAAGEKAHELPVLLAGDFNSETNEAAYQYMVRESTFVDAWINVPKTGYRYGNEETFTDFHPLDHPTRIDFIFVRKCPRKENASQNALGRWAIQGVAVLSNVFQDGIYLSDHRAVVLDALLAP